MTYEWMGDSNCVEHIFHNVKKRIKMKCDIRSYGDVLALGRSVQGHVAYQNKETFFKASLLSNFK